MSICKDLDLNVPRRLDVLLNEHLVVAKRVLRLTDGRRKCFLGGNMNGPC